MKYRIFYENGRWHVREPNGEVTWHFDSLAEASDWAHSDLKIWPPIKIESKGLSTEKQGKTLLVTEGWGHLKMHRDCFALIWPKIP